PRHALPPHRRPGEGPRSPDHGDHHVPRDGHDLLAGEGGGGTDAAPQEFTVKTTMRFARLAALAVVALALFAAPLAAEAQPGKVWRIGVLTADRPGAVEALLDGLRERNYVEGRNLVVERRRFTQRDELPTLAAELVRLNLDLLVVGHGQAALVMKATTTALPIVMAASNDAVAQGIVVSLARPGGNVTGLTNMAPDLVAKRLEILKETAPQASRIAVLGCQTSAGGGSSPEWSAVESASQKRGFHLVPVF